MMRPDLDTTLIVRQDLSRAPFREWCVRCDSWSWLERTYFRWDTAKGYSDPFSPCCYVLHCGCVIGDPTDAGPAYPGGTP